MQKDCRGGEVKEVVPDLGVTIIRGVVTPRCHGNGFPISMACLRIYLYTYLRFCYQLRPNLNCYWFSSGSPRVSIS